MAVAAAAAAAAATAAATAAVLMGSAEKVSRGQQRSPDAQGLEKFCGGTADQAADVAEVPVLGGAWLALPCWGSAAVPGVP